MHQPLKVAHVVGIFSALSETFIYDYITGLAEQGIHCPVLTRQRENEAQRPHSPVTVLEPVPKWHPQRLARKLASLRADAPNEAYAVALTRDTLLTELKKNQPDVVHAHYGTTGDLVLPVVRELELPLVVSFHGADAYAQPLISGWLERYQDMFSSAHALTVVSNDMKDHLMRLGAPSDLVHVIRVGKRLSDYAWSPPTHRVRRWITVGRLTEKKGHRDCVRAFAEVASDYPEATLDIIGEGPELTSLSKLVADTELDGRVTLRGSMSHSEVVSLMASADAFVLCSKTAADGDREGVPTVLMEAQALGLPCVTTTHSGIPEVIPEPSRHFLAEPGHVSSIAERLQRMMELPVDELVKVSHAGRSKIEREFDLPSQIERIVQLYREISRGM